MTRRRQVLVGLAAAAALTLTGCGVEERIVHLQAAPTENADVGAPLRVETAERITARVLGQAELATNDEQRAAVLVGPALRVATARAARPGASTPAPDVTTPPTPTILAMSRGQEWPRAILAATLDAETQTQHLHVLLSAAPTDQFRLLASAPLLPGATVPAIGEVSEGTTFAASAPEAPIEIAALVDEYARGLAFPQPGETSAVAVDDSYAQSLQRNAAQQQEAFTTLATLARTHTTIPDSVVSVETADGGHLVFAQMTRQAVISLTEEAQEVKIEDQALRDLSGRESVTASFTTEHLENVLFVAPPEGLARLVGAEEILVRAEGS